MSLLIYRRYATTSDVRTADMVTLAEAAAKYEEEHAFARKVVLPEEDRALITSALWRGGYRWFRSPNVIQLERYRTTAEMARIRAVLLGNKMHRHPGNPQFSTLFLVPACASR